MKSAYGYLPHWIGGPTVFAAIAALRVATLAHAVAGAQSDASAAADHRIWKATILTESDNGSLMIGQWVEA